MLVKEMEKSLYEELKCKIKPPLLVQPLTLKLPRSHKYLS